MPVAVLAVFWLLTPAAAISRDCGPAEICLPTALGTVTFPHAVHQERIGDCRTCHHQGVEAGACHSCHDIDTQPPKAKDAFHGMCVGCHRQQGGPVNCNGCHTR
ncbi:MAG: cytochrome c3 family protein [Desulfuromonadales bacterium]|nr:cytochrome c3 family protein [Desulfuromonadales bacterium]